MKEEGILKIKKILDRRKEINKGGDGGGGELNFQVSVKEKKGNCQCHDYDVQNDKSHRED